MIIDTFFNVQKINFSNDVELITQKFTSKQLIFVLVKA